ncbi:tellurite resistance TerB family protein [Kaistia terrae]|uniref:Tellurite resistance TerB family protein n=1 Tax=Kaistia terrae TaxID=537017 RepID=A0ABW0PRK5_9HYPH|nr:tellurite resistance TerB family protein [Kaistia terrae]MCX5579986.1 tellurite resistance TerB family protein [Kaistia terrae]
MSEMIDGKSILDQLLGAATGARGGQGQGGLGDLSRMSGSLGSGGGQPASGAGAGGLGDVLGNILGGARGGAGGAAGGGGGLGDLLGGMLGGNGGGSAASAGKSGGGGIGDVVGKVTEYAKQNPGLSMAGAGGLAAVLFGGNGPKLKADALTLGGLAAIGTLAYKAYQQYKVNNPDEPVASSAPVGTPAALPPADSAFHPANAPGGQDAVALSIVTAMIAAAKADGTVDATERQKILGKLSEGGLSAEERDYLDRELNGPLDLNKVVDSATGPEHAIQLYAASLLAIDPDHPAERAYLDMLAARLGLDAELKSSIEQAIAAAGQ